MATPAQQAPRRRRKSSILSEAPLGAVSSANTETPQKPSARRKAQTALRHYHRLCAQHTWVLPLTLILLTLLAYALSPGAHNPLHAALFLSYANPPLHERTHTLPARLGPVTQYGQGPKDLAFVAFYTVVLSFTREFLMQRVVRPVALACGLRRPAKLARFMEQMYTALYFGVAGPVGLYVMSRTPVWYFDVMGMYEGFPHRAHEACFKAYYLLQGAYWAQQALVLVLRQEKPRKDFRELVVHHVVTLSLIALSFRFHFTYMGVAVYVTHDISDFFLATSKCLNYINSPLTAPCFVFFVGVWAYTRHLLCLRMLYSVAPMGPPVPAFLHFPPVNAFATVGSFTVDWPNHQYKFWFSQTLAFLLMGTLQAVNLFWFFLILRILWRYVRRGVPKDDRSDDEDEEDGGEETPVVLLNGRPPTPAVALNGRAPNGAAPDGDRKATPRKR